MSKKSDLLVSIFNMIDGGNFLEIGAYEYVKYMYTGCHAARKHFFVIAKELPEEKLSSTTFYEEDYVYTLEDRVKQMPPLEMVILHAEKEPEQMSYVFFSIRDVMPSNGYLIIDGIKASDKTKMHWNHIKTLAKQRFQSIEILSCWGSFGILQKI